MSYLRIDKMDAIKDFPNKSDQLAIMNRSMPEMLTYSLQNS